ncbi:phospho-N-acetylmuramoyl-pentapeptide-transferase [Rathayibacter toxicus]|uniref:Phospho-N-acetylmuramoyl-pentapeptide-transferase n=1 Tax=Rathayibacter toxicus TaxID=145458 RepID=A0A0C5BH01_9MICO|nr:phospho-N-acetylmuramoyl-pentapeptide-transferase [Rathayibacter toxicus]AJM77475.1 phospho-N-acetylmuramoyl-pentapeptide-transferase [Rathayibacter toxicus]ALS56617.1 phospho-N-acetylmuramoyl-pentapeptide-transferase [Rathayibacter toxicus]KKM44709.1 phospho-N-acetylmuramoyl-pentapeptide-transferase [Rathayibacter toxicus]PPG21553.1 phospho-N-acetylmuramoyl-pentapeptide-transferase [Rathayibacter toxicus]PPG46517.1 phospho-N-acetylmuramoyl-pentapeptide-transferase [Rathayibacter toxicus]
MRALLLSGAFSGVFTLLMTPLFIRLFHRLQWGQFIREDGPKSHHVKHGTATMGGIVIIIGTVVGYLLGTTLGSRSLAPSALLVLFMMVGLGGVGFIDDFLKTRHQRSLGLGGWAKVAGQVIVAAAFAVIAITVRDANGLTPASTSISFIRDLPVDFATLGWVGIGMFVLWICVIVTSASNGVNVADGLDGLATGSSILAIGSYVIIGFWQSNQWCFNEHLSRAVAEKCYQVSDPFDLAIVAAAASGALVGFLWWNTSPAQIFMGDTGSLGLGGALAALAILTRTELLVILIGGLFVIVTGSVILQRIYFKLTRGKRIFLMSPLHHHFELKGWAEITVVVRFWIIAGIFVAAGVGLFYLEWLSLE